MAGVVEGDVAVPISVRDTAARSSSSQDQTVDQLKARIQQLEAHSASLEASLRSGRNNHHTPFDNSLAPILNHPSTGSYATLPLDAITGPATPISISTPGFYVRPRPPDLQAIRKSFTMNPLYTTWDERSRCMLGGFPDVVERGIMRPSEVNKAFQVFKNQFSQTAPMIPFLLSTTPVPKHPFVVLAAIFYVDMLPINAMGMVEESALHAMTGAATTDVLTALYILSFTPCTQHTASHAPLSPLQLVSLAYRIGNDLGLEAKSEKALSGDTRGLIDPWASKRLEELTMWEAVKNRYCMYLQQQKQIVEASREFIKHLAQAEADDQWSSMSVINAKWEDTLIALERARDPDDSQMIAVVAMIRIANMLLVEFTSIIPAEPCLPSSTVTTMLICLACSRRAHEVTKHQLDHPLFDETLLETVEAYAEKLPGLTGRLLNESWRDLFHGTPNENPNTDGVDREFNFDFMDFQTFIGL
ncbi:hypothetical protein IAT40_003823 [Kwoniella sp. CBS 6097]